MPKLTFEIHNFPDRPRPVAELWADQQMIAEINCPAGVLVIDFYNHPTNPISVHYDDLMALLESSKSELLERL